MSWKDDAIVKTKEMKENIARELYLSTEIEKIYKIYNDECSADVVVDLPEGVISFKGGESSAAAIKGAADLSAAIGETSVVITDHERIPHVLSLESANYVTVRIGLKAREAFYKKQAAIVAL